MANEIDAAMVGWIKREVRLQGPTGELRDGDSIVPGSELVGMFKVTRSRLRPLFQPL